MQLINSSLAVLSTLLMTCGLASAASISTFDDLTLASESFFNGVPGPNQGEANPSTFTSGPATYKNEFTDFGGFTAWQGWSYSNTTDTTTAGFQNQYSAFTGSGHNSANYGVAFTSDRSSIVDFAQPTQLVGGYFTNTTYTALSMLNGDSFAKKFGGASGDDPDWFLMTVTGKDSSNSVTGTLDMYLADYRFSDNSQDFILDSWTFLDLSPLGTVSSLEFTLSSSDTGSFGMNTPAYFAMDDLTVAAVPVPSALWLFGSGLLLLTRRARH